MNEKSPDTISSGSRWQGKITDWCKVLRLSKKRQITEVEESFFPLCNVPLYPKATVWTSPKNENNQ